MNLLFDVTVSDLKISPLKFIDDLDKFPCFYGHFQSDGLPVLSQGQILL